MEGGRGMDSGRWMEGEGWRVEGMEGWKGRRGGRGGGMEGEEDGRGSGHFGVNKIWH